MIFSLLEFLKNPIMIRCFGVAGGLAALLGALAAALPYRGKSGERYSVLNHFISELGEKGISRLAWVFNLGLILSGLALLACCIGLGLLLPGIWAGLGMAAGIIASIALALVGVFPMNNLKTHIPAAMTFFRLGLVMILFFTVAIGLQPGLNLLVPRQVSLAGFPAIFAYAFFLLYSRVSFHTSEHALDPLKGERPRFWKLAVMEWLIFLTTILWFGAVALGL